MCRTTQRCLPPGPTVSASVPLRLSGSPCRSRHTRATDAYAPFRRRQELSNHARVSPPTARATRVHVAAHATVFLDVFAAPASLPLQVSSLLLLLFFPFPSLVLFESEARDSRRKTGCACRRMGKARPPTWRSSPYTWWRYIWKRCIFGSTSQEQSKLFNKKKTYRMKTFWKKFTCYFLQS